MWNSLMEMVNGALSYQVCVSACAFTNIIFVMGERLEFSNQRSLLLVGDYSIWQLVLYEKDLGWMAFWD
jgi:hypothetical protein